MNALIRACELGGGDMTRLFIGVTDDFSGLLARHSSPAALWPGDTRRHVADLPEARPTPQTPALMVPLNDREQTVLGLLSTNMSTREMADGMCLSVNTVKSHVAAIYRKLAAAHRRDAVLTARSLDLL